MTGLATSGGAIDLTVGTSNVLTVSQAIDAGNANVTLRADNMTINARIGAGTQALTLTTTSANRNIYLGVNSTLRLGLADAELALLTAGIVRVGTAASTGIIYVPSTVTAHAGYSTLALETQGRIEQTLGGIAATNLVVRAGGTVDLGTYANAVTNLAASTTGDAFSFTSTGDATITTLDGLAGLSTAGGAIDLTIGTVHTLTVSQAIGAGNANVTLRACDMTISAAVSAGTQTVALQPTGTSAWNVILGGSPGVGRLRLSVAELDRITAGTLGIEALNGDLSFFGTITAPATWANVSLDASNSILFNSFALTTTGNVSLTSGSTGVITADVSGTDVTANALTLNAGSGGIGTSANPLRLAVASLGVTTANANAYLYASNAHRRPDRSRRRHRHAPPERQPLRPGGGRHRDRQHQRRERRPSPARAPSSATSPCKAARRSTPATRPAPSASPATSSSPPPPPSTSISRARPARSTTSSAPPARSISAAQNLVVSLSTVPAAGATFLILPIAGNATRTGTFAGLSEGTRITVGSSSFHLTYQGGDGNDVALVANRAPTAGASVLATAEDVAASGTLAGADPDGDPLTFTLLTNGSLGTVTLTNAATGAFTYTPFTNANGSDTFTYQASDGTLVSGPITVTVHIAPVNDPPSVSAGAATTIAEGQPLTLDATGADLDGDPLTYAWDLNNDGVVDVAGAHPTIAWTQLAALGLRDNGTYPLHVFVSDGQGGSTVADATLTIDDTAPTVHLQGPILAVRGFTAAYTFQAADPAPADNRFVYTVQWGDGSRQVVTAANLLPLTHTYAAAGVFNLTVTAGQGRRDQPRGPPDRHRQGRRAAPRSEPAWQDFPVRRRHRASRRHRRHARQRRRPAQCPPRQRLPGELQADRPGLRRRERWQRRPPAREQQCRRQDGLRDDPRRLAGRRRQRPPRRHRQQRRNVLVGGAGNDTLRGGSGRDVLSGGLGAERAGRRRGRRPPDRRPHDLRRRRRRPRRRHGGMGRTNRTAAQRLTALAGGGLNGAFHLAGGGRARRCRRRCDARHRWRRCFLRPAERGEEGPPRPHRRRNRLRRLTQRRADRRRWSTARRMSPTTSSGSSSSVRKRMHPLPQSSFPAGRARRPPPPTRTRRAPGASLRRQREQQAPQRIARHAVSHPFFGFRNGRANHGPQRLQALPASSGARRNRPPRSSPANACPSSMPGRVYNFRTAPGLFYGIPHAQEQERHRHRLHQRHRPRHRRGAGRGQGATSCSTASATRPRSTALRRPRPRNGVKVATTPADMSKPAEIAAMVAARRA